MSTLPWFIDLTFQVPMQYRSLEHHTLLSPPDMSTTECHFHLDPASSFFLKLFLCFSTIVFWTPTDLGALIFWCCIILPFHTVHTFLKVRILEWCVIPFSSGRGFVRSLHQVIYLGWPYEAWLIASLSYTRLWSMWSLWLGFCHCGFCFGGCEIVVLLLVCLLMDEDKRFCKFPDVRARLWGKLSLALGDRAMLRNSLIQLPAAEWGWAPSSSNLPGWLEATQSWHLPALWWGKWQPTKGLKPTHTSQDCFCQSLCPAGRPLLIHTFVGDPQILTGRSDSVFSGIMVPFSWVLVHTGFFFVPSKNLCLL